MKLKIALIGFGNVGQGTLQILKENEKFLKEKHNAEFEIVAISDPIKGAIFKEDGIEIEKALYLVEKYGNLNNYEEGEKNWDSLKTIKESNADVIVELTPTNLKTGEPGLTHIKTALENGKHVVTTNKGPIALFYKELKNMAERKNLFLRFEGTVMSGTPVFSFSEDSLHSIKVNKIRGILNGTTNFILTLMHNGESYDNALKKAQELGYAEANPEMDVKGLDAMAKIIILSNVIMNSDIKPEDVQVDGITEINLNHINESRSKKKKIKLVATAWKEDNKVKAKVSTEEIDETDILYYIDGVKNAICFSTEAIGEVIIIGPGAGKRETGFAVLSDLLKIYKKLQS